MHEPSSFGYLVKSCVDDKWNIYRKFHGATASFVESLVEDAKNIYKEYLGKCKNMICLSRLEKINTIGHIFFRSSGQTTYM
jgi:hypothetical protein